MQNIRKLRTLIRRKYFGLSGLGTVDEEMAPYKKFLKGVVLNAGAGRRPVQLDQTTITTDFDEDAPVDFLSDLHFIPLPNGSVDSILSIAVLEHTQYPWLVIKEFERVLRPGGVLVICLPFLQPEHAVPHDFYRYTIYGVQALLTYAGLTVIKQTRLSRFHRALGWILNEKWKDSRGLSFYVQSFIINQISRKSRDAEMIPYSVYTGSYSVAQKAGAWTWNNNEATLGLEKALWLDKSLVDPITKLPLKHQEEGSLENDSGQVYGKINGIYDLRPKGEIAQDHIVKWGK